MHMHTDSKQHGGHVRACGREPSRNVGLHLLPVLCRANSAPRSTDSLCCIHLPDTRCSRLRGLLHVSGNDEAATDYGMF